MAAAILVLPFGPGLVAWMVLGRGLSAAPPLGVARLPFDASAVTATWAAATLAAAACLASLLTMTLLAARTAVGQPGDPPLADDGAARRPSAHEPSPSAPPDVVRRQGLALTAVAAVLLPLLGRPLLAAADADAERTFAQWAHRRCADDVAREAGREGRSRLRPGSSEDAAGEARGGAMGGGEVEGREAQICGAAPSRSAQAGGRTAQRGRASRAAFADAVARLTAEVGL
jgi:hypothetical protein